MTSSRRLPIDRLPEMLETLWKKTTSPKLCMPLTKIKSKPDRLVEQLNNLLFHFDRNPLYVRVAIVQTITAEHVCVEIRAIVKDLYYLRDVTDGEWKQMLKATHACACPFFDNLCIELIEPKLPPQAYAFRSKTTEWPSGAPSDTSLDSFLSDGSPVVYDYGTFRDEALFIILFLINVNRNMFTPSCLNSLNRYAPTNYLSSVIDMFANKQSHVARDRSVIRKCVTHNLYFVIINGRLPLKYAAMHRSVESLMNALRKFHLYSSCRRLVELYRDIPDAPPPVPPRPHRYGNGEVNATLSRSVPFYVNI